MGELTLAAGALDPLFADDRTMADLEARFGPPVEWVTRRPVLAHELAMIRASSRGWRAHDVTFFIRDPAGRIAAIRKPSFPPGAFRVPSGGVRRGEEFLAGVQREALEETGLRIELERYLLRVRATFTHAGDAIGWTSHVFSARGEGELRPRDTDEVAEARWVTTAELQGPIRAALLRSGRSLLAYRVALTDRALALADRRPSG